MTLPKPIKFTREEGGEWRTFEPRRQNGGGVAHAIMFDDASVFDMVNGWRPGRVCPCCGARKSD